MRRHLGQRAYLAARKFQIGAEKRSEHWRQRKGVMPKKLLNLSLAPRILELRKLLEPQLGQRINPTSVSQLYHWRS